MTACTQLSYGPGMQTLHQNQKRILSYLLENTGGASLDELSIHLGITKTAVKEHLTKIELLGYLTHVDLRIGVGRPKRKYLLTPDGHEVFPRQYSWLSNVLLEHLADDLGKDAILKIMTDLADKVSKSVASKFDSASSHAERLKILEGILNELGYRSALKQSDVRKGAILEATNCVYHTVAKKHPELCRFDVRLIENSTGLDVNLESCIARGGTVCRFCLKEKSNSSSSP